jgi:hypothetical protein
MGYSGNKKSLRGVINQQSQAQTAANQNFMTTRLLQEHQANHVTMSIVLVKGHQVFDLLSQSFLNQSTEDYLAGYSANDPNRPRITRKNGRMVLANVTLVDLMNILDYERIVGLLLGRRAGIFEALNNLNKHVVRNQTNQFLSNYATWNTKAVIPGTANLANSRSRNQHVNAGDDIHFHDANPNFEVNFNHPDGGEGPGMFPGEETLFDEDHFKTSTLMISFNVSYGSVLAKKKNYLNFRLVCPCGDSWNEPGKYHVSSLLSIVFVIK